MIDSQDFPVEGAVQALTSLGIPSREVLRTSPAPHVTITLLRLGP